MKVKALITLHADGDVVKPGETVNLENKEAKALIERGFATTTDSTSVEENVVDETENAPSIEDIIEVIEMLDPETDYGKSGKPNVDAIESVLEANISANMRDQAWEQFQKDHEANAA